MIFQTGIYRIVLQTHRIPVEIPLAVLLMTPIALGDLILVLAVLIPVLAMGALVIADSKIMATIKWPFL